MRVEVNVGKLDQTEQLNQSKTTVSHLLTRDHFHWTDDIKIAHPGDRGVRVKGQLHPVGVVYRLNRRAQMFSGCHTSLLLEFDHLRFP